jgi:hypothetical protein
MLVKTIVNAYPYFGIAIVTFLEFVALKLSIFLIVDNICNIYKRFSHFDVPLLRFKLKNKPNFCLVVVSTIRTDS